MYDVICDVLDDMGFVVMERGEDFDINDYIADSIMFISFIVGIENKLNTCLTDDYLSVDLLKSAKGFANKLSEHLS